MKITENTVALPVPPTDSIVSSTWPVQAGPIAPWWHTALLVAFLITVSVLTTIQSKGQAFSGGHIRRYLFGIAWEWVLAAMAWWGIRMRHVTVRQIFGQRRYGWREWMRDLGAAMIFWLMAMVVLAAIASLLRLLHLMTVQKAVLEIAPQSAVEFVLWFVLCTTAGIVEEFVFRGYLLQQFASLGGRLWLGVVLSSLLFGASHGYEGLGAMITIGAFGAMFCILTIKRKSLRAGMMAHAWHDGVTGVALAIVKHLHMV